MPVSPRRDLPPPVLRARLLDRRWSAAACPVLLVADPDGSGSADLDATLHDAGLSTVWCGDGAAALAEFGRRRPAAVLLAPRLEHVDTPTVVRIMRDVGDQPILVGVGAGDVDRVGAALVAGATGAVARPYDAREVCTRLEREIRDLRQQSRLVYGPLVLDPQAYRVAAGDQVWDHLPLKEFELLRLLMTHADQVVTVEQIKRALWGDRPSPPTSNAITVHVGRLRSRLAGLVEIRAVRGRGYRLTA